MEKVTASYWNKTEKKSQFSTLNKDIETDILIIGGEISGITCAYCLAQKGKTCSY